MAKKDGSRRLQAGVFIGILLLFITFGSLVTFFTDYLWFQEMGYTGTFLTRLRTQLIMGVPLFLVLLAISNLYLIRLKKRYALETGIVEDKADEKRILLGIRWGSVLLAAFLAVTISSRFWFDWLTYTNGQSFGITDPIFARDISYYVFRLPLITGVLSLLMSMLFMLMVLQAVYQFLLISSRMINQPKEDPKVVDFDPFMREKKKRIRTFDAKTISGILTQIGLFGAAFFVLLAVQFWLRTYSVLYSTRGDVFGAGYTDISINLNLFRVLAAVSLAGAAVFAAAARRKNLRMALAVPAALVIISVLGGFAGGLVQRFVVEPDEINKERTYIERNIAFTRKAYALDRIKTVDYPAEQSLTAEDIQNNRSIIDNIRINDYSPTNRVYNQIQGIRPYYIFNDVDIDRYTIDGLYTQVFLAAREMEQTRIDAQAQNWINLVLKYTHGYGVTLSPVNTVTPEGQPALAIRDIPPRTNTDLLIQRPEIYFGESTRTYIIVNTEEGEFDYPSGSDNVMTIYQGDAGIPLTPLNRLLFTMRQRDFSILISSNINSESRIVINRHIVERVRKIAPFLAYGHDPYIVINQEDGRLYWILDGMTLTDRYPYSEFHESGQFNYIRNSVKVVVDAYNGTTDFYISDPDDALVQTYAKIFPDLFKDIDAMPEGLRRHVRYAQDYFDVQSDMYRTYHMTNPTVFFGKEDIWEISREKYLDSTQTVESNYLMFRLHGEENVEFLISVPYSPVGRNNMSSMLVGRCDGENYGELLIYRFPRSENIPGTNMIESRIDQDSEISPQLTLWSQEGSSVLRGNLLIIPIEDSLLYIEPIYLQSRGDNALPEMKRVIATYGDRIVMENTLNQALAKIFGDDARPPDDGTPPDGDSTTAELIQEANRLFEEAQEALRSGDWSLYGQRMDQLETILNQLAARSTP